MTREMKYERITFTQVPEGIIFHTLRRDQGQIVTVAWGDRSQAEHGPGDPYKRVIDQSLPTGHPDREVYYKRVRSR